ncbi:uncharacterized protein LOC116850752 isoform X1 [Odontomachus brunneus]|uniref:uncharacterized protein LOC116850752 isoform X1 n=1 Tax=Odontomachus brunneus TaxID=486640 RepID=UPI0013F20611|nr:uncharacterized protein LOC116850752 isoform X1 [Odontomachus brunneus]
MSIFIELSKFNGPFNEDYVTGPLTLYNALEEADLLNNPRKLCVYVIHIIGGNIIDVIGLKAWEILLHLLQNIRKLYIVMISPEMVFESAEYDNLCHECISCSQKLYFDFVSESYNNYLKMESYKFPNIIVGFEAKISVKYLSSKFLSEVLVSLSTVNCPLLLTAKSHKNVKEIIYILGKIYHNNKLYITKKNDFSSCRPNRDYSNGEIIFRNSYFIIYK